ncbi:S41 family peptidase [Metabacillus herbersteinensis]|uniref:S41 family peptidase n=1 Tax=Metabacillus herbersteinensis TaxID=283816 RepID=A0ABV6GKS7_9BACI
MKKIQLIIGFILTAVLSAALTYNFTQSTNTSLKAIGSDDPFEKLRSTYETIQSDYYQDVDSKELVEGAINGMVESIGDPYSDYMSISEAKSFNENISSSFEGIGAEVQDNNGKIMIVSPIKGSPAEKAGIKPKDKILQVDEKSVEGMTVNEAVMLIRGEKGTKVKLLVERDGVGELELTIIRDTIPLETVYTEVIEGNIGKIQITKFSETTGTELAEALTELNEKNVDGLVLDLRQNPGGLMDQAIGMSELFIPKGKTIMQVENKDGSKEVYKSEKDPALDVPVVVVVDNGTASAAEIMAAALHQSAGIPVVGEKTFGKGTIQSARGFDDGSSVKYTIAKWLTPDGTWVHEKGFKPQYEAKLPEYANLPYLDPDKTLKEGDSSPEVKTAQQMLKAVGYDEIGAEGYFDSGMKQTVEKFQKDQDLTVTGEMTSETIIKLMETIQKQLSDNDTQVKKAIEVLNENN